MKIWFLILGLLISTTASLVRGKCVYGTESFILSTNTRLLSSSAPTTYDHTVFDVTLSNCTRQCHFDERCHSITFLRHANNTVCQLSDVTIATAGASHDDNLTPARGTYYLEKMCLLGACDHLFVAEALQGMELQGHDNIVLKNTSRQSCLESCLQAKTIVCRSAEFDSANRECRLSRHDRFDRKSDFRKSAASVEYFDVTCHYKPPKERQSVPEMVLLGNVEHPYSLQEFKGVSLTECADLCVSNSQFPCRSFLSGRVDDELYCGLSHQTREGLIQNPASLIASKSLNYYEIAQSLDTCDENDLHFELITGTVLNVNPYKVTSELSPKQCLELCKRESRCHSIGIDYRKGACQYNMESIRQSLDPKLQKNGNFNYFEKICLPAGSECKKDWAFERVRRKELVGIEHDKMPVEANTKEECQEACLNYDKFECRSAEFNYQLRECKLSPYNRFSSTDKAVTLSQSRLVVDYFENNCITETRGFCNSRILKKMKMLLAEKTVLSDSLDDCQEKCYENEDFVCRSVTFDPRFRTCGLSHHTRKSAPQESLIRYESNEFLEILTCFSVSVDCEPDVMLARIQTNSLFKGKVYAKGKPMSCSTDVRNSLEFTLPIPLTGPSCGTVTEEEGKFSNVLVIQSNDHVVTAMDKAIGVHCSYDVGNKTEETEINITDPNSSDKSRGSPSLPDLSLHIVDMKGEERETVSLGELLRVQVRMSDEDTYGIFVRNLVAKDGAGENNLTLIDNTGCPVEAKMMREVRTIDPHSKSLEGYLEAFTFTGSSMLELEAEVETCLEACKPVLCQIPTLRKEDDTETVSSFGRKKREAADDKENILSTVMLTKSLSIVSEDFEAAKSVFETNYAIPVTAPSQIGLKGEDSVLKRKSRDYSFCFDPTMFALVGGTLFCLELLGFSVCLIAACRCRKKASEKNSHLSIYYENSSDGSDMTST